MPAKAVILLLFIHCLLLLPLHNGLGLLFCCVICVKSSFAIILRRMRELVVFFFTLIGLMMAGFCVSCVGLQSVIVIFPGHTHFLFYIKMLL